MQKNLKKIFLSTSNIQPIPAVNGGATETLIDILIEQNEKNKKCIFYILSKYNENARAKSKEFKYSKIIYFKSIKEYKLIDYFKPQLYEYIFYKIMGFFSKSICPPRFYFNAYQICKKIKPDYFVAEGGIYEHYELISKLIDDKNRFAHLHRVVKGNKKLWSIFPNAIAITDFVADAYKKKSFSKDINVKIVRNCCNERLFLKKPDLSLVQDIRNKLSIKKSDFVILFNGRVVSEKGVLELINSVEMLNNKNLKLLIIGTPIFKEFEETEYWQKVKKKAHQNDFISLIGYIPNYELLKYFEIADLCVVPSVWDEPAALVPLEAMTYGLPVIITNSGGMIEYQKDDCVSVVSRVPNLAKNLAEEIEKLYNNSELRNKIAIAGHNRSKDFSSSIFYKEFLEVFNIYNED